MHRRPTTWLVRSVKPLLAMKRANYDRGGAGRGAGRGIVPQKAPLPFNLPSMRREQGYDTATGGIAAAGAKWASPRPTINDSPGHSPLPQASTPTANTSTAPSPAPAWGGAGLRTRATGPRSEFPTLRTENPSPVPSSLNRTPLPPVPDATMTKVPDAPPPPVASVQITPTQAAEDDWADDEEQFDLSAPIALPEVSVAPPPPQQSAPAQHAVQQNYGPRDISGFNRAPPVTSNRAPVASHWAPAFQRQQQHHQQSQMGGRPQIQMPDRKLIEEQKNLMKAKAESAKEARRHEEEERERLQRERAREKLRALEKRMCSPKPEVDSNAWRNTSSQPNGGAVSTPAPAPVTPKVLLRRPVLKETEPSPSANINTNSRPDQSRRKAPRHGGDKNRSRGRDGRDNRNYDRRNKLYDEPLENETREQWLERRRKKTEARDAVRFVLELCIKRAVYGHPPHRGHRRRGTGRRYGGRDRNDNNKSNDPASALPALALPSTMNPVEESVLVPTVQSPAQTRNDKRRNYSSRGNASLAESPRGDRVVTTRQSALHPARPAPWAHTVQKVALAPPVSSPGTRTVASVVDAVVGGELEGRGGGGGTRKGAGRGGERRKAKRGGRNERIKRERRELAANNRSVEATAVKVAESTAAAAAAPSTQMALKTVGSGTCMHKVLPSAGRGAGFLRVNSDDAWSSGPKPTSFDDISRAFSNTKGLPLVGAPIIPTVPIIPTTAAVTPAAVPNGGNWPSGSAVWPGQTESVTAPKWIPFQNTSEVERNAVPIPTVPPLTEAPLPKPPTSRRTGYRKRAPQNRRRNNNSNKGSNGGNNNSNGGGDAPESRQPKAELKDLTTPAPLAEKDVGATEGGSTQQRRGPRSGGGRRGGRGRSGQSKVNSSSADGELKPKGRSNRRRGGGRGDGSSRSGPSSQTQTQPQLPSQQTPAATESTVATPPKPTAEG